MVVEGRKCNEQRPLVAIEAVKMWVMSRRASFEQFCLVLAGKVKGW